MTASAAAVHAHRLVDELVALIRPMDAIGLARAEIEKTRRRYGLAGYKVDDICWTMLLDLYVSEAERRPVSVSSMCMASMVAQTTALRKITFMLSLGLIEREADANDSRRSWMSLSAKGRQVVHNYLSTSSTGS